MVKSKVIRIILMCVGFISLILGVIGIALPILPTAPFFLLTSFCFVKSSEKFNNWFLNTKMYKKYIENFEKHKVMKIKSELILIIGVSAILLTSMYFINNLAMTIIFTLLILCKCSYFAFRIKPVSKEDFILLNKEKESGLC